MMKNYYRVILIFSNCMTHLVKTYYPYHFWPDWPSEATKAIAKPEYEMQCAMRNKCIMAKNAVFVTSLRGISLRICFVLDNYTYYYFNSFSQNLVLVLKKLMMRTKWWIHMYRCFNGFRLRYWMGTQEIDKGIHNIHSPFNH